jgi:hypothetical protein
MIICERATGSARRPSSPRWPKNAAGADQSLTTYGQKIGVRYRLGTLTGSLRYQQQLFLHEKLFNKDHYFGKKYFTDF